MNVEEDRMQQKYIFSSCCIDWLSINVCKCSFNSILIIILIVFFYSIFLLFLSFSPMSFNYCLHVLFWYFVFACVLCVCECCACVHLTNHNHELNPQYLNDWDSIKLTHIAVLLKHNVLFMFHGEIEFCFQSSRRWICYVLDGFGNYSFLYSTACVVHQFGFEYFNWGIFELVELSHWSMPWRCGCKSKLFERLTKLWSIFAWFSSIF